MAHHFDGRLCQTSLGLSCIIGATLVKAAGFILVFPITIGENAEALGVIAILLIVQSVLRAAVQSR